LLQKEDTIIDLKRQVIQIQSQLNSQTEIRQQEVKQVEVKQAQEAKKRIE
jgi:hypothetical protein